MSEKISVHNMFSLGFSLEFSCIELVLNSIDNLSSYCGLFDAKIRASDKDLPVTNSYFGILFDLNFRSQFSMENFYHVENKTKKIS